MKSIVYNEGLSQEDEGRRLKSSAFQIDHSGLWTISVFAGLQ